MSNTQATVVQFFRSKGLPDAAIAGILGNLQVESGFNTGAANANEGAIGLAQWEGGRRTALDSYAKAHGLAETDINAQLGYMWQELTTSYSGVLQKMRSATDPGQAAAIWDGEYEVSSGAARSQRISAAQSFASGGLSTQGAGAVPMTSSADGSMAAVTETPAQKKADLIQGAGPLAGLLNTIPELKKALNDAVNKGWTNAEFQNAITNTNWYRTHSDAVRTNLALQASNPAQYKVQLDQASAHVKAFFQQYGIAPNPATFNYIVNGYFLNGRNDDQLLQYVQAHEGTMHFSGGAVASAYSQVQKIAAEYGIPLSRASQNDWSEKIGLGQANIDTFTQTAQKTAMSMYPGMADQIKSGLTMKDIADPYVQTMSNLLETNPNTIDWTKDPTIKKALQGTGATAAGGTPTATPLWQFEQQVRADPKWQLTKNAHQATSQLLTSLGQDWGFQ